MASVCAKAGYHLYASRDRIGSSEKAVAFGLLLFMIVALDSLIGRPTFLVESAKASAAMITAETL